jgi:hypothetical protein
MLILNDMKNIIKLMVPIFAMSLLFSACEEKEMPVLTADTAPTLGEMPTAIIIDKDNVNTEKFTIQFASATYSAPVAIASCFEIARTGTNFDPSVTLGDPIVGIQDEVEFTYKELNAALTALGLEPGVETPIEVRVRTYATAYQQNTGTMSVYSAVKTMAVTSFEPQSAWIYAVGAFQNWNRTGGHSLISLLDNGVYSGYIDFPEVGSPFLLMPDNSNSWDHKWGSDDGATLIKDGGSDIQSPGVGYHQITVDLVRLSITMVPYSWGVIGDATPTGWDSDTDMIWNYEKLQWELTIQMTAGSFKIRLNNAWDTDYGITNGVVTKGGDNIPVGESGTYVVCFDEENLVITLTKQ